MDRPGRHAAVRSAPTRAGGSRRSRPARRVTGPSQAATCPEFWRHSFATLLQDANVDPLMRQQVMGHKPTTGNGLGMTLNYPRVPDQPGRIEDAAGPLVTLQPVGKLRGRVATAQTHAGGGDRERASHLPR